MGSCTAGGAYVPAKSDESVIVRNQGTIFLGGPPLVKAATGEVVSPEDLGGGDVHTRLSGVSDWLAQDDRHALAIARRIVANLNWRKPEQLARSEPRDPLYDPRELHGVLPTDTRRPYDVREVIARIVDGSELDEWKARYGTTLVTGFARVHGMPIGVIANNGILYSESAMKAAHFIELCCQRRIPLLFLQNISGFMVGRKYENEGIARNGAKMVTAVACAQVPKFTVIIGGSFGAGNYGMCGRGFDPRFIFSWPSARTAVMGGAQAAKVMDIVNRNKLERMGLPANDEALAAMSDALRRRLDAESAALFGTARLWDDGIIDPRETRRILGLALRIAAEAAARTLRPNTFGIARL
jgi:3-methylcrotonyl-CoA carboxylase beta subunit